MKFLATYLNPIRNNPKLRQAFTLMSWNFFGIPLGMLTNIVITRFLGSKNFGDYMYINNIFNFAIILFNFGLFQAANRAIVLSSDKQRTKEYFGAELMILLGVYVLITILLFTYSFVDPNIRQKGIQLSLMYVIPFSFVYILMQYFDQLLQADNRIDLLVITRYYPRFGFFIAAIIIFFLFNKFDGNKLVIIWSFFLGTQMIIYAFVLRKLHISFNNLKTRISEIFDFNKSFGLKVYTGNLFSTAIAQLTPLLVSYFGSDNTGVGYYSLAFTLVSPLSFIPNVIATTHYKEFSTYERVPQKIMKLTLIISLAALIVLMLLIPPFINFFYRKEFAPVISLCHITSIGVLLYGLSDFFSKFIGAHGNGVSLRNSSFIVGLSSLLFSIILIPRFHETGAALTYLVAGLTYIISITYYYRKLRTQSIH